MWDSRSDAFQSGRALWHRRAIRIGTVPRAAVATTAPVSAGWSSRVNASTEGRPSWRRWRPRSGRGRKSNERPSAPVRPRGLGPLSIRRARLSHLPRRQRPDPRARSRGATRLRRPPPALLHQCSPEPPQLSGLIPASRGQAEFLRRLNRRTQRIAQQPPAIDYQRDRTGTDGCSHDAAHGARESQCP
jgi:hypothetical protein